MCKCFDLIKDETIKYVKKELPKHQEFKAKFENKFFFFGENKPKIPVTIPLSISYRGIKNNGEPCKNLSTKSHQIIMSFCPFCRKEQR